MTPEEFAAKLTPASFAAPRQRFMTRVLLIAQANSQRRTPVRTGTLRRSETTAVREAGFCSSLKTSRSTRTVCVMVCSATTMRTVSWKWR